MASELSESQKQEARKILDYLKKLEKIVHTSGNRGQVERIQKEMRKLSEKLASIVPGVNPLDVQIEVVEEKLGLRRSEDSQEVQDVKAARQKRRGGATGQPSPGGGGGGTRENSQELSILDKFPTQKASPNSTDEDINFLATVLWVIQIEYWPVISNDIARLDFSHASERDSIRTQLDNVFRSLKVLTETIEEYAQAEKQDFREQVLKMKNRQSRIFLFEANDFLKLLNEYLKKLAADVRNNAGVVMNKNEVIHFDSRYHSATMLEGRRIGDAIREFQSYVEEARQHLHMPDIDNR